MLRDSVMKIHSCCNFGYYHAVVLISDCIYRPHSKRASRKYPTPPGTYHYGPRMWPKGVLNTILTGSHSDALKL